MTTGACQGGKGRWMQVSCVANVARHVLSLGSTMQEVSGSTGAPGQQETTGACTKKAGVANTHTQFQHFSLSVSHAFTHVHTCAYLAWWPDQLLPSRGTSIHSG